MPPLSVFSLIWGNDSFPPGKTDRHLNLGLLRGWENRRPSQLSEGADDIWKNG